jgi:hypothetical protein
MTHSRQAKGHDPTLLCSLINGNSSRIRAHGYCSGNVIGNSIYDGGGAIIAICHINSVSGGVDGNSSRPIAHAYCGHNGIGSSINVGW